MRRVELPDQVFGDLGRRFCGLGESPVSPPEMVQFLKQITPVLIKTVKILALGRRADNRRSGQAVDGNLASAGLQLAHHMFDRAFGIISLRGIIERLALAVAGGFCQSRCRLIQHNLGLGAFDQCRRLCPLLSTCLQPPRLVDQIGGLAQIALERVMRRLRHGGQAGRRRPDRHRAIGDIQILQALQGTHAVVDFLKDIRVTLVRRL